MSKRDSWGVEFPMKELQDKAQERADYHRQREAHWSELYESKSAEMRDKAKIEEVPITGGVQPVLRYDPGLQATVNLAQNKRDSHQSNAERYERFLLMFQTVAGQGEEARSFMVDVDDIGFFFKPIPKGEEE